MNHLDRHYDTELSPKPPFEARRDFRISLARFTASIRKLERMTPEHRPTLECARKSALRMEQESR